MYASRGPLSDMAWTSSGLKGESRPHTGTLLSGPPVRMRSPSRPRSPLNFGVGSEPPAGTTPLRARSFWVEPKYSPLPCCKAQFPSVCKKQNCSAASVNCLGPAGRGLADRPPVGRADLQTCSPPRPQPKVPRWRWGPLRDRVPPALLASQP